MRLDFDLPKWAEDRFVAVTAGKELVAFKKKGDKFLHVKTDVCNMCGECCKNLSKNFVMPTTDGVCNYLVEDDGAYKCSRLMLDGARPHVCDIFDPVLGSGDESFCSIRYKKVEIYE